MDFRMYILHENNFFCIELMQIKYEHCTNTQTKEQTVLKPLYLMNNAHKCVPPQTLQSI